MSRKLLVDEHDINFDDTRQFVSTNWRDLIVECEEMLFAPHRDTLRDKGDWFRFDDLIREMIKECEEPRFQRLIQQAPIFHRALRQLTLRFEHSIHPKPVNTCVLSGAVYLNVKLSSDNYDKLKRTTEWHSKTWRLIDVFIRSIELAEDDQTSRITIFNFLEELLLILCHSINYFQRCSTGQEAVQKWPQMRSKIVDCHSKLDELVKHLNDINNYSKVNRDRELRMLARRMAPYSEPDEPGNFPVRNLPFARNELFYGRSAEMKRINDYLDWRDRDTLRTYTIYGRRGVGKTQIALEYAYRNIANFDAIFWIQCETASSLRQSILQTALSLGLTRAEAAGHFEENLMAVQKWLKQTKKHWLLVFDNAEDHELLQGYWPLGANGAILLTSRDYYNFLKDNRRRGETVLPFTPEQSWTFLLRCLGPEWEARRDNHLIHPAEIEAGTSLLRAIGGLALAIHQSAALIKDGRVGDRTVQGFYEKFKDSREKLPPRPRGKRTGLIHSLDAIWSITFEALSDNALAILRVLGFLSPDTISLNLFLPQKQSALRGPLAFCALVGHIDSEDTTALARVAELSPALDAAIRELETAGLIRRSGGHTISIHRESQEAVIYHNSEEFQEAFDAAARLVYEAFPKQAAGKPLQSEWKVCEAYIQHAIRLADRYDVYDTSTGDAPPQPCEEFAHLLANVGWYLYEISHYTESLRVVKIGIAACNNEDSLLYAHLQNTAGTCYMEQNNTPKSREAVEIVRAIREAQLPDDDPEIANVLANLGNVESAEGQYEEALDLFRQAAEIRIKHGDSTAVLLALTWIQIGRVYFLQHKPDDAYREYQKAEMLLQRASGKSLFFQAHLQFGYGNLELRQNNPELASRAFEECLKLVNTDTPLHPLACAANYKLACVESQRGNNEKAIKLLGKAMTIADIRNPGEDDGTVARILNKQAEILDEDPSRAALEEASELRMRAENARRRLLTEVGIDDSGEDMVITYHLGDSAFDKLVPAFFR